MTNDSTMSPVPASPMTAPNAAAGVAWGGGMLILLSLWLRAKFDELSVLLVGSVALLGALGVALAAWHALRAIRQTPTLAESEHRRALQGAACMAGGALMVALAVALWFFLGLNGFGECVGLLLLGLLSLACGKALRRKGPIDSVSLWNNVREHLAAVKIALVVLGGGAILGGLILAARAEQRAPWFPELAALLLGGVFFLGAAFWLQLQSVGGEIPLRRLQMFALVVGGWAGFIITVMILMRMFLWRDEVFLGGLDVWSGERSWRLWLCAYVLLGSLALMFGSLFLARGQVHEDVVLRRTLYGYNTVFTGILLLAILILFNILFFNLYPYTFNWSRSSFSSLSPATKNLVAALKEPTTLYVIMSENQTTELRPVVDNYRVENPAKITVEYISPERDERTYLDLAARFKEIRPEPGMFGGQAKRGVLIVYGRMPADPTQTPAHAFIPDNKIFEVKSDEPPGLPPQMRGRGKKTIVFKAEPEITKELRHLLGDKEKRKLYVLQGDGELDINNQNPGGRIAYNEALCKLGIGRLEARLKKVEYEVQGLRFARREKEKENIIAAPEIDKKKSVPDDAYAVVIPGATEPLDKDALDALERFVDKGGRLVAFFDTIFDDDFKRMRLSGLEDFLKKYGVDVRPEYAITVRSPTGDARDALVVPPERPQTVLAKQIRRAMVWQTVRVVKALPA